MENLQTFYVIRANKEFFPDWVHSKENAWYFDKGWYVTKKYVKSNFKDAKFFNSAAKAKQFLNVSAHIGPDSRMDYFDILEVIVQEPKQSTDQDQ
jgi:hypothetical protein